MTQNTDDDEAVCTSVKIIDFGISAVLKQHGPGSSLSSERAGTLLYMAPEQLTKPTHSKKVDMWALGVIMYQLLSQGKHPYHTPGKESETEFRKKMERLEQEPLNVNLPKTRFSKLAIDFFNKMCVYP